MISLLLLFAVLFAAGLFFILADVLKLPTMGAAKAMLSAGKQDKKAAKTVDAYWVAERTEALQEVHSKYILGQRKKNSRAWEELFKPGA